MYKVVQRDDMIYALVILPFPIDNWAYATNAIDIDQEIDFYEIKEQIISDLMGKNWYEDKITLVNEN